MIVNKTFTTYMCLISAHMYFSYTAILLLKGYSCGSSQVVAHSWGNVLHTFTASITIYDAGQHILFVVAKIDDLHLYRYQEINVITFSGEQCML